MNSFAIVRSTEDLPRACQDLGEFFSTLEKQGSCRRVSEFFFGIWLHPRMTATPPSVLSGKSCSASDRQIHIGQSVSLSEVWTLCWLDSLEQGGRLSRHDLLRALVESSKAGPGDFAHGQFIPVFHRDMADCAVKDEFETLRLKFPDYTLAPRYLDPATAALSDA